MKEKQLASLLTPILASCGLELDGLSVVAAGRRRVLRVTVDGDGPDGHGPTLDEIAEATRAISVALDESDAAGDSAYTLEVSSRGVSRPLTTPAHWRRNRGRLVKVQRAEGEPLTGRILDSDETSVRLGPEKATSGEPVVLEFGAITKALVQVELNPVIDLAGEAED